MKKYYHVFIVVFISIVNPVFTHKVHALHFKGGMLYHVRYINVQQPEYRIEKPASGLGGKLSLDILPWFRAGGMGFSSSCTYATDIEKNNFYELGFGGITAEFCATVKKFTFSAGGCLGGGSVRYLHTINSISPYKTVRYNKISTMVIAPFATTEYTLTKRISLCSMLDWVFAEALPDNYSFGPAFHLGILFGH